ncbi:DUF4384 domain-containing protein [Sphingomonas ursincola]
MQVGLGVAMQHFIKIGARLLFLALSGSLSVVPLSAQNSSAAINARPQGLPERATTNFDASLRCMDDLLSRAAVPGNQIIYASPLSEVATSGAMTRDLVIASLARISEKSRIFNIRTDFEAQDEQGIDRNALIVSGSVTGFEENISGKGAGAGVSLGPVGLGFRDQSGEALLTITIYFQDKTGYVVPLTTQSLSMALKKRNKGADVGGSIGVIGGFLDVSFDSNEGVQQAVRALIDVALIQAVGSWAQVPYQRCMTLSQTDTGAIRAASKAFKKLKPKKQISLIAAGLAERGLYAGLPPSELTPELRAAISSFQTQQQLPALGLPTFEVYFALYGAQFGAVGQPLQPVLNSSNGLAIKVSAYGPGFISIPSKKLGDSVALLQNNSRASFAVSAARDAHLLCYYTDAQNRTTKVLPNLQRPSAKLRQGETLVIPGPQDIFVIKPEVLGAYEYVSCFASATPFEGVLPASLLTDFTSANPQIPVKGPDDLLEMMRHYGPPDLSYDTLTFRLGCLAPGKDKIGPC